MNTRYTVVGSIMLENFIKSCLSNFIVFKFQMRTPAIQNDFSYYRRVLMREGASVHSFTDQDEDSNSNLNVANKVSLFYAEATPMLRTLSNVTSQFLNKVTTYCHLYYTEVKMFCIIRSKHFTDTQCKMLSGKTRIKRTINNYLNM